MRRRETTHSGLIVVETTGPDGFAEIGIYRPTATGKQIAAVVSRQIKGGKWCVYTDKPGVWRSRVKRQAIAQAVRAAERADPVVLIDCRR